MVRSTAVTGDGGGGGDGGFAPSQYVASAIRTEREEKSESEGGKMAAKIKFLRSLEKMPRRRPRRSSLTGRGPLKSERRAWG